MLVELLAYRVQIKYQDLYLGSALHRMERTKVQFEQTQLNHKLRRPLGPQETVPLGRTALFAR
jgi:hypothetical protein